MVTPMLAAERQTQITELVSAHGAVRVTELVETFGVSDMTIRRDLDALAAEGTVQKVHGGAVSTGQRRTEEPGFSVKSGQMEAEKAAIANAAAQMVEPGMSVALSAGTTTWALAQQLREVERLTVVTNSTRISDIFHDNQRLDRTVILTGGIRTRSDALVGPTAIEALRSMHVDLAFMGAHGVSAQAGLTTPNYLEADTNSALMSAAQRSVILADHSKWGVVGVMTFAQLAEAEAFIVDDALDAGAVKVLQETVQAVHQVPVPRPAGGDAETGSVEPRLVGAGLAGSGRPSVNDGATWDQQLAEPASTYGGDE